MQYTILIAAAFILATIAVAALSPFDSLPDRAPQQQAKITPPAPEPPGAAVSDEGSSDDESESEASDDDGSSDEESSSDGESQQAAESSNDGYQAGVSSSGDPDEEPVGEYHGEE